MLPSRIILDSADITVCLREGQTARTLRSEAILDINHEGKWIRGIELLGGIDFNLAAAVKPFKPKTPLGASEGVTYDEEVNAAFIYFSMRAPQTASTTAPKYSHSITPEAEFGFDAEGGLLWLRFSCQEENANPADFVSLIDAPVERFTST